MIKKLSFTYGRSYVNTKHVLNTLSP